MAKADDDKSRDEWVTVTYLGPSGRLVDGELTYDLNVPVRVPKDRFAAIVKHLPEHTFKSD